MGNRKPFLKDDSLDISLSRQMGKQMANKKPVLMIGAGIAGLQASLDLAKAGFSVYLVEEKPYLGGHVSLLCKVFPTFQDAKELLKPIIQGLIERPNVKTLTYSEIEKVEGVIGNFRIKVLKKARYVDEQKCTLCDECAKVCPVNVSKDYEMGLGTRKAIYLPCPYPMPSKYLIDKETCLYFKDKSCHACRDACPENAIVYDQVSTELELEADEIIVATGFKPYNARKLGQYKYGIYKNVVTGMEYERLCALDGPTEGKIVRVDNQKKPKSVAYILCVGSREQRHLDYCCRVGCLNALKHALTLKEQYGSEAEAYICYTDMRTVGKTGEKFYRKVRDSEVIFVHGEPSEIRETPDKSLTIDVYDQATSKLLSITADLIVLETGLEPRVDLKDKLKIPLDESGFFKEAGHGLSTNETPIEGIFLAGTVQEPMNITETLTHASAAAMKTILQEKNLR
jgi:heterodisulfide reductase subunit A